MIDRNIIPVPGMVIRNSYGAVRTVEEFHKAHTGECPGHLSIPEGDHVWYTSGTYNVIENFYNTCTLISSPQKVTLKETTSKPRLQLISD